MCRICEKASANEQYISLLSSMQESDVNRLGHSKSLGSKFPSMMVYSNMEYPFQISGPLYEPKLPMAKPMNYFQNVFVNGEKLQNSFSHGSMRSIFFLGGAPVLFSKSTSFHDGEEFFSSFLLLRFETGSGCALDISPENRITFSSKPEAKMQAKNLISGKTEQVSIEFNFVQENIEGKLLGAKKTVYSPGRGPASPPGVARQKSMQQTSSVDMMLDYSIGLMHFSPHPYMLKFYSEFGYETRRAMQGDVVNYFKFHHGAMQLDGNPP